MELAEKVLEAMKIAGVPVNAGKLVELTGFDRKEVDKAMKTLKANDCHCFSEKLFLATQITKKITKKKSFCKCRTIFFVFTKQTNIEYQ